MKPIELILSRLERVRKSSTRAREWSARCPAHQDKSPSLSITEKSDSTVLLRCRAGCPTSDVLEAIGLRFKHLFPRRSAKSAPSFSPGVGISVDAEPIQKDPIVHLPISYEAIVVAIRHFVGPSIFHKAKPCPTILAQQAIIAAQTNEEWRSSYNKVNPT